MEYSESETFMATLQGWVPDKQPPEAVTISIIWSKVQSTMGFTFFSQTSPNFCWVI
jgi:hypothetical protein